MCVCERKTECKIKAVNTTPTSAIEEFRLPNFYIIPFERGEQVSKVPFHSEYSIPDYSIRVQAYNLII